jgi:uroporphyrinogen-III synthase
MRLLVTRPEPDASTFAEELRALGHEPVLQPLIEFRSLPFDTRPFREAQAIVITSGNSLRALQESSGLEEVTGAPLYCVGEETERKARSAGFQTVLAVADTAEELAAKIIACARKDQPLIHVTGEHQAFDLAGALNREGFSIESVPVYSMAACGEFSPSVDAMLKTGEINGVVLMSPRTAEIYVSLCHRHANLNCAKTLSYFCISENVASKLASLKPEHVHISEKPNRKALLVLLGHAGA